MVHNNMYTMLNIFVRCKNKDCSGKINQKRISMITCGEMERETCVEGRKEKYFSYQIFIKKKSISRAF